MDVEKFRDFSWEGGLCLGAVIEENDEGRESVGDVVATTLAGEELARGNGPEFLASLVHRINRMPGPPNASDPPVFTFGGLAILKTCWDTLRSDAMSEREAVRAMAASPRHVDVAFDFVCDNGYEAPWDTLTAPTLGPDYGGPVETASGAASQLAQLVRAGLRTGALKRRTMAGGQSAWPLAGGTKATVPQFRAVPKAAQLARKFPPDQSWKSHGIIDPVEPAAWALLQFAPRAP